MSGDVTGTIVSKNVVRDSHQRCYVLHGMDNVMVENNVALNATGHCYILEGEYLPLHCLFALYRSSNLMTLHFSFFNPSWDTRQETPSRET